MSAYRFAPTGTPQRVRLPLAVGRPVAPDDVLEWAFYADDAASLSPPWASLAVCVDVLFDDGTRLSEAAALDRYGFAVTAAAQFAARWSMPEQWNANAVALAPWTGRRITTVECVLGADGLSASAASGYLEVAFGRRPEPVLSAAERVDTRRGTHSGARLSRGNTIPAVAMPHGFAFVTPATDAGDGEWPYRYHAHDTDAGRPLEAIQFSHQPSPWIGDRGVLQFMPFDGAPVSDRARRRRFITPGSEVARPHRYAADLGRVAVEATATERTSALRVTGAGTVGFVIDQHTDHGRLEIAEIDGQIEISGWVPEGDPLWGNAPRMFFYGQLRAESPVYGVLDDAGRARVAGFVAGTGAAELRIATSFLSLAQARRTLTEEAGWARPLDELVVRAREAWDAVCTQIELGGVPHGTLADNDLRAQIAASLYRLHLYPNAAWERTPDGDAFADPAPPAGAHGDERTGAPVRSGRLTVNTGYWDTYRTAWPLLFLLDPPRAAELIAGCLAQSASTGWMPRWAAPGPVDSMVGTSSDQVFADAALWGIPGSDDETAFETGWRNACEPSPDPRAGRAAVAVSRFTGSVPAEVRESFGWTIEGAISDAALAAWAARLSDPRARVLARYLGNRSRAYRRLFDGASGFFRSRDAHDRLAQVPFDPAVWGGDYVETNAWGMSVSAVHDGDGLAALYGGRAAFRKHLDALFAEPETGSARFAGSYRQVIHEQREARAVRAGMCALSNQPAHHIAAMHVFGDEPWRAGPLVRELAARLFCGGHIGQGFPGDADNGEMSAWWLWALIGLYPLVPGSGELLITSPLADDLVLRPHGDTALRITCDRPTRDARYLTRVELDGARLPRPWVPVTALARGGTLRLTFAAEPDPALWRRDDPIVPWHPDLARPEHAVAPTGLVDPSAAFDDRGAREIPLAAGAWIGQRFPGAVRITDATITLSETAPAGAVVFEASTDGQTWEVVAATGPGTLPAERTSPVTFDDPSARVWWRLRALAPVRLRQLELFDLDSD